MRKEMQVALMAVMFLSAVSGSALVQAEDELAPGFNKCMDLAQGRSFDMSECVSKAYVYWDQELNTNYKKALAACAYSENPDKCKAALIKSERAWISYKEAFGDYLILQGGGSAIGSLDLLMININQTEETKRQSQKLLLFVE